MRKILAAGVLLAALSFGPSAYARPLNVFARPGCPFVVSVKHDEHAANRIYADTRTVTLHDQRELGYFERCERNPQAQWFVRSYNRARWQQHYRRQAALRLVREAVRSMYSGDLADVPGVPRSFAACVALRESTNGKLSPNIYGLLSYYGGESLAEQKRVFSEMYGSRGVDPWQPYDHCPSP